MAENNSGVPVLDDAVFDMTNSENLHAEVSEILNKNVITEDDVERYQMNKVFLIGRLTRDPELRYTGRNIPVATFSLAVNRPFTAQSGEREADFINIVVWRKQA